MHTSLRANQDGDCLEVISVMLNHNHDVSQVAYNIIVVSRKGERERE